MMTSEQKAAYLRFLTKLKQKSLEFFDKKNITVDPVFEEKVKTTQAYTDKVESMFKQVQQFMNQSEGKH